jgi:methionine aminopeptidase
MKNIILTPGMIFTLEPLITGKTMITHIDHKNRECANRGDIG